MGFTFYSKPETAAEAHFFYKEIFRDRSYDIAALPEDAMIIDAGANIGLSSLYMKRGRSLSRILAFEPAPDSFQMFRRNMQLHTFSGVEAYQCGWGREKYEGELTYFPMLSGILRLHPQQKLDAMALLPDDHPL